MFTDTDSFYYSLTGDITNSIQRQFYQSKDSSYKTLPLWKKIDDRFFWNRHMLSDLINLEVSCVFVNVVVFCEVVFMFL